MNKNILGILGLFIFIFGFTALSNENFLSAYNLQNLLKWSSLYAIMGIGVAFVIITGGIDLSIGSVIGLVASLMALMVKSAWDPLVAVLVLIGLSLGIGLVHGLLVTKMKLQPFVVTLCGLLFYRGISRWATDNQSMGYGDTATLNSLFSGKLAIGSFGLPAPFFFLVVVAVLAAIFLNRTIWGRYLLALGNNEKGARYSGIGTDRLKITAYVICSFLAGLSGLLFAYELDSVQPAQTGEFYELYAIAAAVLGGCSLRGGEASILGVFIAAALIRVILNATNILGIPSDLDFAVVGAVLLLGVSADEVFKRYAAKRAARQQEIE